MLMTWVVAEVLYLENWSQMERTPFTKDLQTEGLILGGGKIDSSSNGQCV